MAPKRPRGTPNTDSSQSQSQSQSQATPTSQVKRAKKRPRQTSPPAAADRDKQILQNPVDISSIVQTTASTSAAAPVAAPAVDAVPTPLVPIPARKIVPGKLRRLSRGHPAATSSNTRPGSTLSGEKIGGKSKDLRDGPVGTTEEIWVTRKKGALGFGGYLKKACRGVEERGVTILKLHAMGAAIPLALSLAMAIRDSLPGGSAIGPGSARNSGSSSGVISMKVTTGTTVVNDEITPDDEDKDLVYQTRQKSTIDVELKVQQAVADMLGATARARGAGDSSRGRKRHGATRGRGRGRGRG